MATERPDQIPETKGMWRKRVQQLGQEVLPLHQMPSLQSASKIDEKQFLAFRVIWPKRKGREALDLSDVKADVDQAEEILTGIAAFQDYLAHIDTGQTMILHRGDRRLNLGVFSSARRHQLETVRLVKRSANEAEDAEMPDAPAPREHPQPGFYTQETGSTNPGESQSKEPSVSPSDYHPSMMGSIYEIAEDMPGPKMETISESIVNAAALQYLAAICEATTEPACEFLDFRQPFENFETLSGASMEARTDGILQGIEISDIFAIVEVKPRYRRRKGIPKILWQESVEFVAWINHDIKHKRRTGFPM